MTNDGLLLLCSALGGGLLGLMFFGGLLWTLRNKLAAPAAGFWFAGSFLVRSGVCVAGFFWIGAGDPLCNWLTPGESSWPAWPVL